MGMFFSCISGGSPLPWEVCLQHVKGFPEDEPGYALGVSACYAGVIGDQLVMAGGCNFPESPAAEGGVKRFYRGIYTATLTDDSVLTWKKSGDLPVPAAYGVTILFPHRMIIVGGSNAGGGLSSVWSLSLADSGKVVVDTLPSLPCALDNMAGALCGNTMYIVGGNRNGIPSVSLFSFNSDQPGALWKEEADFPGTSRVQPVCAAVEGALYMWGGFSPSTDGGMTTVHTDGWCYLPEQKIWEPLLAPVFQNTDSLTLTGGVATAWEDSLILCVGGVNKEIFQDAVSGTYSKVSKENYLTQPIEWYQFNEHLLVYNIRARHWEQWTNSPVLARAGAALVNTDKGLFYIGGEVKPGIRSAMIYKIMLSYPLSLQKK